jgi:hypothetical protein
MAELRGVIAIDKSTLPTADIRSWFFKNLQPKSCRTSKSKSSEGLNICRDLGLSNPLSRGLIAAAAWPAILKISPETHSLFSSSPRFASCSESFV